MYKTKTKTKPEQNTEVFN